jgi:2-phosphosulfolactate phosphatase
VVLIDEVFLQSQYSVRFEWGLEGVRRFAPISCAVVIVDVLSFSTCVDIAVARDAVVFPYRYKDASARTFAQSVDAMLAGQRGNNPSLSPASLVALSPQSRLVLPSPNGSTCTIIAGESSAMIVAGSLRNAAAVANFVQGHCPNGIVSVIACGEHWPDGTIRPAIEDLIGAGSILSQFNPHLLSPEAKVAVSAFHDAEHDLQTVLRECSSGRELTVKGFPQDVGIAGELNKSSAVPVFQNGAYVRA